MESIKITQKWYRVPVEKDKRGNSIVRIPEQLIGRDLHIMAERRDGFIHEQNYNYFYFCKDVRTVMLRDYKDLFDYCGYAYITCLFGEHLMNKLNLITNKRKYGINESNAGVVSCESGKGRCRK